MPIDPVTIIGEILGEPAGSMRNPVNAGYLCPYINSVCTKRGHLIEGPYPVCSLWRGVKKPELVCVCPNRFYGADIVNDVLDHAWPGRRPQNPHIAHEVKMDGFGKVDFVLADINPATSAVRNFVSVELQAVDISGSVQSAYSAVTNNQLLNKRPTFGMNWGNVRKRYVSQLISKGFFHHHWKARMVAVLQESLYNNLLEHIAFDEMPPSDNSNILFMIYGYSLNELENNYTLSLKRVVGTSHSSLMTGPLYRQTPDRSKFCEQIVANINKLE